MLLSQKLSWLLPGSVSRHQQPSCVLQDASFIPQLWYAQRTKPFIHSATWSPPAAMLGSPCSSLRLRAVAALLLSHALTGCKSKTSHRPPCWEHCCPDDSLRSSCSVQHLRSTRRHIHIRSCGLRARYLLEPIFGIGSTNIINLS